MSGLGRYKIKAKVIGYEAIQTAIKQYNLIQGNFTGMGRSETCHSPDGVYMLKTWLDLDGRDVPDPPKLVGLLYERIK